MIFLLAIALFWAFACPVLDWFECRAGMDGDA